MEHGIWYRVCVVQYVASTEVYGDPNLVPAPGKESIPVDTGDEEELVLAQPRASDS